MFAWWKNDLFFGRGHDQNGGEKKPGKVVWRSQKQLVTFLGRGRDQCGPKKLVVTFWSGATKPQHSPKLLAQKAIVWMTECFPPSGGMQHHINLVLEQSSLEGPWILKNIAKWPLVVMFKPATKMIPQTPMRKEPLIDFFQTFMTDMKC